MINYEIYIIAISCLALLYSIKLALDLRNTKLLNDKVAEITSAINKGAMTFLNREYKVLAIFALIGFLILYLFIGTESSISFVLGTIFSAVAGNIGMRIATMANGRTAEASKKSLAGGLRVAFSSGLITGLSVVSLGLIGVTLLFIVFKDPAIIFGFGLGASSVALFTRVGGGIYTKAADVGADLVGKVEKGIPEDDPRNPAVIADNVGDNVGDVAGMGADLFESYVDSLIAAMVIGAAISSTQTVLPLAIAAVGLAASVLGSFFVTRTKTKDSVGSLSAALNRGIIISSILTLLFSFFLIDRLTADLGIFWAVSSGLIAGVLIGLSTEYFTSNEKGPTISIAKAAETGAGTNIISGISVGMLSTVIPVVVVSAGILIAHHFAGLYGIAIAAVGMLSTLGITLAADSYGPVADNAAGIAEMADMGKETRERAETLDAVGNTTAAIGKGFAIGSAALAALALFTSYMQVAGIDTINIGDPKVVVGIFTGSVLTFLFSSMTMGAVSRAAIKIVEEVRRQFKTIKGLMEGTAKPDYEACIDISTRAAIKEMIAPAVIAITTPVLVGIYLGKPALGGLLVGATATGFLLAVFMANAGGAWDNAKKYIEEGNLGGKGSNAHKAAVVGDTVGDPFKDTSGPSLNILIKLMAIVSLVFLPLFL